MTRRVTINSLGISRDEVNFEGVVLLQRYILRKSFCHFHMSLLVYHRVLGVSLFLYFALATTVVLSLQIFSYIYCPIAIGGW